MKSGELLAILARGHVAGILALACLGEAWSAEPAAPNQPPPGMVLIPAGSFLMGDTFNELTRHERVVHEVEVSAFYLDRLEVTGTLWNEVKQWATNHGYAFTNAGAAKAPDHPVHSINWYDALKWCNARSEKEGRAPVYYTGPGDKDVFRAEPGNWYIIGNHSRWNAGGYRLPTEAEWEKAARGGKPGLRYPNGNTLTHKDANFRSSAVHKYPQDPARGYHPDWFRGEPPYTSVAGSYAPNGYGLCDMAGNVREMCWDIFHLFWYTRKMATAKDPRGLAESVYGNFGHVTRGGSWNRTEYFCRSACRDNMDPQDADSHTGFRTVLSARGP